MTVLHYLERRPVTDGRALCGVRPHVDPGTTPSLVCARCRRCLGPLARLGRTTELRDRVRHAAAARRATRILRRVGVHPEQVAAADTGELTTALALRTGATA